MKKSLYLSALTAFFLAMLFNSCVTDPIQSGDTELNSFKIVNLNPVVEGIINRENSTIEISLPYGTEVDSLMVELGLPANATVFPESGSVLDFTNPVVFTVVAEDGSSHDYTATVIVAQADFVYNFEDLALSENSFWNGPDNRVNAEIVNLYGTDCEVYYGSFREQNAEFSNTFNDTWKSWSGFSYSNMIDVQTPGYTNQYSVFDIYGANESKNFAIAYAPEYSTPITNIVFDTLVYPQSVYLNNSTYAYLSMKNGDDYTKAFSEGDYMQLEVEGFDNTNTSTGIVEFYLADFQNGKSEILSDWKKCSLESLGQVQKLEFKLKVSQSGVPTYFCLDDLVALK